ncbi:MAG: 50S ribosomal protein L22 [Candidatus Komeilibacteria bacterium RIFCSPLOWO2_01_FULL_52_15]|uniref:Large ribosomal subunit protein uL22 n=2 Tax=Candidatus Komeiliibacteriota TaxID=1817908 RepID=A0A1G2BPJ2_9BACT|nr:MAG: 50S ribosomal protein L22 [Candidatus Komeilibacteria bacterium RIFCSPHIGHO2_01_FULL_52_14]OGY91018.1 MAG: 50S ribosomal protein L22 [Candidatus Komeilibacteria bacterium RIFCSPLOWO2_01_FULL_52_15]
MIEVRAQLNNFRMAPKKVRLVTDAIKGMDVEQAISRLQFLQKKSAPAIMKLIRSAVANARHNNSLEERDLRIKNIIVNEGIPLKRWRPAAFGSAHSFKHRASHVSVVLTLKEGAAKAREKKDEKKPQKADEKKAAKVIQEPVKRDEKKTQPKAAKTKPKKSDRTAASKKTVTKNS